MGSENPWRESTMSGLFRWVGKEQMLTPSIRDIDQNLSCVQKPYVHRNS